MLLQIDLAFQFLNSLPILICAEFSALDYPGSSFDGIFNTFGIF
jgi:hypothetical protein